jgi:hypothetical protein
MRQYKFGVQRDIWSDNITVRIGYKSENNIFYVAKPITMEAVEAGTFMEPCFSLMMEEAQLLMDNMWDAGVRPSQSVGTAGQLDATKYHLEDMRKLVFKDRK